MDAEVDCGSDVAAYLLGALEDDEVVAFRRHLSACASCRGELDEFAGTVAALPLMVPQYQAPPTLRRRVMAEVRGDAVRRRAARPARSLSPGWGRLMRPMPRPALAGFGALLVAAVVVVAITGTIGGQSASTRYIRAAVAFRGGGAVLRVSGTDTDLLVKGMPAPAEGKIYEVWLKHGDQAAQPTRALFDVNAQGDADVDVPGHVTGGDTVMVTQEPDGGSLEPTLPALIVAPVS